MQEKNTYSVEYAAECCIQDRHLHWGSHRQQAGGLAIREVAAVTLGSSFQ